MGGGKPRPSHPRSPLRAKTQPTTRRRPRFLQQAVAGRVHQLASGSRRRSAPRGHPTRPKAACSLSTGAQGHHACSARPTREGGGGSSARLRSCSARASGRLGRDGAKSRCGWVAAACGRAGVRARRSGSRAPVSGPLGAAGGRGESLGPPSAATPWHVGRGLEPGGGRGPVPGSPEALGSRAWLRRVRPEAADPEQQVREAERGRLAALHHASHPHGAGHHAQGHVQRPRGGAHGRGRYAAPPSPVGPRTLPTRVCLPRLAQPPRALSRLSAVQSARCPASCPTSRVLSPFSSTTPLGPGLHPAPYVASVEPHTPLRWALW